MRIELTRDRLPELMSLVEAIERHDRAPFRTLPSELEDYFDSGLETESLGLVIDGVLAGYGVVRVPRDGGPLRCSGGTHPDFRGYGLGRQVVDFFDDAARRLAMGQPDAMMEIHVDEGRDSLIDLLERAERMPSGGYVQLRRALSEPRAPMDLPSFFRILPWSDVKDTEVGATYRETLSGLSDALDSQFFVPEWSFVIVDGRSDRAKLAAYLLSHRYEQDWSAFGWSEGYTEELVVLPDYRGLHLATSLLNTAADSYEESGMEYAGMDISVDAEGQSPMLDLFTHFGYEPIRSTTLYAKRVFSTGA
ncbi:GNAT family N-acetyltransferase [Flaviflexus huanghaiensis]|uniref:GNAT family N-acetyltransferase n=1 Tax=Flaviflexus huanghaiensis TaxID=1111473 RepID=UPI0015FAAEB1|nr:GNAT family N-acetyltransferase [Flaviflexus huanghaiensis]